MISGKICCATWCNVVDQQHYTVRGRVISRLYLVEDKIVKIKEEAEVSNDMLLKRLKRGHEPRKQ